MIGRSKEVDRELGTIPTGSCNCVCVLGRYSTTRCFGWWNYGGNKSQTTECRNMGLGYRAILFVCFRKAHYREKVLFFSLPHFMGAQIVFCLRGQLATGQAGYLASPPLLGSMEPNWIWRSLKFEGYWQGRTNTSCPNTE
ncbi:hypothetical protein AVEN_207459-1 [Araneus ventricosus]|uniref:Uncharacterized protein n=1 Tax=Araneus ventricosus TaxID=182803 RepID=A0A4Y2EA97_ARAVE|nr:hypothetical protein AVEN_207459-1 [Araneus ventricosus]